MDNIAKGLLAVGGIVIIGGIAYLVLQSGALSNVFPPQQPPYQPPNQPPPSTPGTGTLSGKISRAGDGYPLAGVNISLTPISSDTPVSTKTDSAGSYSIVNIPYGKYNAKISLPCYNTINQYLEFDANNPDIPLPLNINPIPGDTWTHQNMTGSGSENFVGAPDWIIPLCDSVNGMRVKSINLQGYQKCWQQAWSNVEVWISKKGGGNEMVYSTGDFQCGLWESKQNQVNAFIQKLPSGADLSTAEITQITVKQTREGSFDNVMLSVNYYTP